MLVLLESCLQTCMTYIIAECTVNKLLMMDRRTARNMWTFMTKQICEISASSWFCYKETSMLGSIQFFRKLFRLFRIAHTVLKTAFEQDQDGTAVPSWLSSKAVFKTV